MSENAALIREIEAFCKAEGIAESTFGFRAVNDGKLVTRLRSGRTVTLPIYARIRALLDAPLSQPSPSEASAA